MKPELNPLENCFLTSCILWFTNVIYCMGSIPVEARIFFLANSGEWRNKGGQLEQVGNLLCCASCIATTRCALHQVKKNNWPLFWSLTNKPWLLQKVLPKCSTGEARDWFAVRCWTCENAHSCYYDLLELNPVKSPSLVISLVVVIYCGKWLADSDPVNTYPDKFENANIFPFWKISASTRSRIRLLLLVNMYPQTWTSMRNWLQKSMRTS